MKLKIPAKDKAKMLNFNLKDIFNAMNINGNTISPIELPAAIKFNDTDFVRDTDNNENLVNAPKNIDRLEEISAIRYNQRKQDEEDEDDGSMKLNISDQSVSLNDLEVYNMDEPKFEISDLEEFTLPDLMSDSNA